MWGPNKKRVSLWPREYLRKYFFVSEARHCMVDELRGDGSGDNI
jgi:hypothetical protein